MYSQTQTITKQSTLQSVLPEYECLPHKTTSISALNPVLRQFTPISITEMGNVALLRRTDTKYVLTEAQLCQVLAHLSPDYYVLEIDGRRQHRYQTLYFDTPDFKLYQQHHNGWKNRYKVRTRTYIDSHSTFLEVKQKTNKDITIKSRLPLPSLAMYADPHATGFLRAAYPQKTETLEPKLWNTFTRITLVSKHDLERLTLDRTLEFWWGPRHVMLPGLVIAEVKQEGFSLRSDFIGEMRALGRRPMGFSKYCIGAALLYESLKQNAFKPKLRYVSKLMQETTI